MHSNILHNTGHRKHCPIGHKWAMPCSGCLPEEKDDPWISLGQLTRDSMVLYSTDGTEAEQTLDTDFAPLLQIFKVCHRHPSHCLHFSLSHS